jgi:TonB family protein
MGLKYHKVTNMRCSAVLFALISTALCAQDSREVVNRGVAAFKSAHYREAVEFFQQAVSLDPNAVNPHLYLGTAYMSMWIPGLDTAETPANDAMARSAETEFKRVLELDPINQTALASLASLTYNSAPTLKGEEKMRKFDEAMDWYKRLAAVAPTNKEAPYSMGVIAWAKSYPALMLARADQHLKPEDPGPLANPARQNLKAQYFSVIEEGILNLDRALQLDPGYSDATAYMNLLIRERADLRDTKEAYAVDFTVAVEWVQKALEAQRNQPQSNAGPPPASNACGGIATPTRIRVGGNVQQANLVKKVAPIYPPLARQAHIEGIVRFTVIIGRDGSMLNTQLVSGHPLLVASAVEALKQWIYKPTMLNGCPVEVITQVDIDFALAQANN